MSYTSEKKRANPASLALAVTINGGIILAVALSPIVAERIGPKPRTWTDNIPIEPKPVDIEKPKEDVDTKPLDKEVFVPRPDIKTLPSGENEIRTGETPSEGTTVADGKGGGEVRTQETAPELPVPIFAAARRNPKFANAFQPDYPPGLLQREIEGTATVRVLDAQVVSATHPDFGKATVRQALRHWRFLPATRGDLRVEDWQTLTVRFTIN